MATIVSQVVTIHPAELNSLVVPASLRDFINPQQWANVCQSVNSAADKATCYSCGIELGICFCTAFIFIFCCHPCIYALFHQAAVEDELRRLNAAYYGGSPVFGMLNGCLTVNMNYIVLTPVPSNPVYTSQPYAPGTAITKHDEYQNSAYNASAVPVAQPVTAVPVAPQQQRILYVTVPHNAAAGSTMPFATPTGQVVQVTIPVGAVPGQQLMVYY